MTAPLVLALAFLVGLVLRTIPSEAHASLVSSVPPQRATVASAPPRVVLTFNERLEPAFSRLSVWDAAGQQVDLKDGTVDPSNSKIVNVSLPPLPPGRYTVRYRVLSVDGHIVEASFLFWWRHQRRRGDGKASVANRLHKLYPLPGTMRLDLVRRGVLWLAILALLLQGGSLPHQHRTSEPGLFNHDHDLGALATVAGALLPLGPDPTPTWVALAAPTVPVPAPRALAPRRHADPRAPPPSESSPAS